MKRFRYAADPLCVLACAAYVTGRWLLRQYIHTGFWHDQFADLLLIPAALPFMLWLQRRLGLRAHDDRPTWSEIGFHFVVWSVAAEAVAPLLFKSAVGDWYDVLAYGCGAVLAGCWWNISLSFDLLAPHYGWMETLLAGPRLQRCRTTWIAELAGCRHLLVAGVGHGPALAIVLRAHPQLHITCVDASVGMLTQAKRRAQKNGADLARLNFVRATLPDWQPAEKFDVIATHFFLDCFRPEQLATVVSSLAAVATPEARWIVSDFAVPACGWRRIRARAVHALMYGFFRVATRLPARRLTSPDTLLQGAGFQLRGRHTSEWGLLQADWWQRAG